MIEIHFKSGTIPFEAVVASLTSDKSLGWHSLPKKNDQREAKFRIKRAFDMILTTRDQPLSCLEIRMTQAGDTELFLQDMCIYVRESVEKKLEAICTKEAYFLTFLCTCSQMSAPHLMKVDHSVLPRPPTQAVCLHMPLDQKLSEDTHLFWFVSPMACTSKDTCGIANS